PGPGDGQLSQPIGVAVDASGRVLVADSQNGRIQKFTNDGTFLGVVCLRGELPYGVAVDHSSGSLFVSAIYSILKFACPSPGRTLEGGRRCHRSDPRAAGSVGGPPTSSVEPRRRFSHNPYARVPEHSLSGSPARPGIRTPSTKNRGRSEPCRGIRR